MNKVYLLCTTAMDYLEIWEYIEIKGVFSTKTLAKKKAIELELDEYTIIMKRIDK